MIQSSHEVNRIFISVIRLKGTASLTHNTSLSGLWATNENVKPTGTREYKLLSMLIDSYHVSLSGIDNVAYFGSVTQSSRNLEDCVIFHPGPGSADC